MRKVAFFSCFAGALASITVPLMAKPISDVSSQDSAYPAIQRAVDRGYLGTFQDNKFMPDSPVTRKELALTIDQLSKTPQAQSFPAASAQTQDLVYFAKNFKQYLTDYDAYKASTGQQLGQLQTEQKSINHDMTALQDQVAQLKKENQNYMLYSAIGIVAALILAIAK